MTLQLVATGTYSNGTTRDVSSTATWTSTKASVATIGATGLVSTVAIGSSTITATLGGVAGSATMMITPGPPVASVLHTFGLVASDGTGAATLIQASDGNFYGTAFFGGTNYDCTVPHVDSCGTVYRITPKWG